MEKLLNDERTEWQCHFLSCSSQLKMYRCAVTIPLCDVWGLAASLKIITKKNNNCSLEVWSNWCQLFYYLNHVTQVQFKTRKTSWGWTGPSSAPAGTGLYFNQDLLKLGWAPANYLTLPYQRCILTEYRQLSQNTLQTPTSLVPGMGSPQIKQNCI